MSGELQGKIEEASVAFDELCQRRHEMGEQKYGPVKFMTVNSIQEAMAEVLDLGNYARYTFIKLWLLNDALSEMVPEETLGANSFMPNREETS
jgi:hypothetical protein